MIKKYLMLTLGMSLIVQPALAGIDHLKTFIEYLPPAGNYSGHVDTNPSIECSVTVNYTPSGEIFVSIENPYDKISHTIPVNDLLAGLGDEGVWADKRFNYALFTHHEGDANSDKVHRETMVRVVNSADLHQIEIRRRTTNYGKTVGIASKCNID